MLDEKTVYKHLKILGVPTSNMGYKALVHAIMLAGTDSVPRRITTEVYPKVAELLGSTKASVEHSIRRAVERVYSETDSDVLMQYFGNTAKRSSGKLTNREFIYGVIEYIKQEV